MSLHPKVLIYCDNNDDRRCLYFDMVADADECETKAGARAWMKREGWVHRDGKDLCTTCKNLKQRKGLE